MDSNGQQASAVYAHHILSSVKLSWSRVADSGFDFHCVLVKDIQCKVLIGAENLTHRDGTVSRPDEKILN